MAKLYKTDNWEPGLPDVYFNCPGCKCDHGVWTQLTEKNQSAWGFNGSMDKPTFSPSILVQWPGVVCHSIVKDGTIQFLSDCTHELAGKTVELPEV